MSTVIFDSNTKSVFEAIRWCDDNFGNNAYTIDNQFPHWRWLFRFQDSEQAVHFALKWT